MSVTAMAGLEAWAHLPKCVLSNGRCSLYKKPGMTEDEQAAFDEQAEAAKVDQLRSLAEDKPIPGKEGAWNIKLVGDQQPYKQGEGQVIYAVNVIESLRWPGATTVAQNGEYCSIYIGDGVKNGDSCFNPTEPPEIMSDPKESSVEQPEPQGKERKVLTEEQVNKIKEAIDANEELKE